MKPRFKGLGKLKPSRALIGLWRSDREMTLEYWAFSKSASRKYKKTFRAKDFFGVLYWKISRETIATWYPTLPIESEPYRIIWENWHSVAIVFPGDCDKKLRQIVFVDPDRFYCLAGLANCEWFKRVKSNKALERAARVRAKALQLAKHDKLRAGAQRKR